MHELSLYGQVGQDEYRHLKAQLAGVTRMQPRYKQTIHLIFRARTPSGLDKVQATGGTQGVQQQDVQKTKAMLNAGLYHAQLVGEIVSVNKHAQQSKNEDRNGLQSQDSMEVDEVDTENHKKSEQTIKWQFEFKDTPESGKQAVSARLVSRTPIEQGNLTAFMSNFGYDYVSRYAVEGYTFYDQDTTVSLHRVLLLPQPASVNEAHRLDSVSSISQLTPLDPGNGYILQASIDVTDGNNQELKDRATRQLLSMRATLRQSIDLTPGDRLALDTKTPAVIRR